MEIEVLEMGSPGLFGMFGRLARVKLTLKEAEDEFEIDIPEMTHRPARAEGRPRAPPRRKAQGQEAPAPQEAAQEQPAEKEKSSRTLALRAPARSAQEAAPAEAEIARRARRAGSPVRRNRL